MERDEIDYGRRSSDPSAVYSGHNEFGYGTNWGPNTGGRDEVWMLQNFIRSLGANRETLSCMHEARLLIECINASVRAHTLLDKTFGESPHRRNRGRVRCLCGLIDDPCSASWFVCFLVPLLGTGKTA